MNENPNYLEEFLKACHNTNDINSLLCTCAAFIEEKFPPCLSAIIGITAAPFPFVGITETPLTETIIKDFLHQDSFEINKSQSYVKFKNYLLISIVDDADAPRFIIIISDMLDEQEKSIQYLAANLQRVILILFSHQNILLKNARDLSTDLINHISHDINSLITLVREENTVSSDLLKKISYWERMNQDLLFYMRDLEYAPVRINSEQLIHAILAQIQIAPDICFTPLIEKTECDLVVDPELIDMALKKIIENAIRSAQIQGKKLQFITKTIPGHAQSNHKFWLMISICDDGTGIPHDYIDKIKQPFFTTFKAQGHSGFGLSIVEKIIHAHNGVFNIFNLPDGGVKVEILLPLEEKK